MPNNALYSLTQDRASAKLLQSHQLPISRPSASTIPVIMHHQSLTHLGTMIRAYHGTAKLKPLPVRAARMDLNAVPIHRSHFGCRNAGANWAVDVDQLEIE